MPLNVADIVILAVLTLSVLFGLWRGFVGEILSLLCWIAAFWVAWAFGDRVAAVYQPFLREPTASIIAGYVTCFLGVLVVGALLGWAMRKLMDRGGLRGGDRALGSLFGLVRGLLLVTFAVLMLGFTPLPRQASWWRHSMLLPGFEAGATWVAQALPPDVTHHLELGGRALVPVSQIPISTLDPALPPGAAGSSVPAHATTSARAPGHAPKGGVVGQ